MCIVWWMRSLGAPETQGVASLISLRGPGDDLIDDNFTEAAGDNAFCTYSVGKMLSNYTLHKNTHTTIINSLYRAIYR